MIKFLKYIKYLIWRYSFYRKELNIINSLKIVLLEKKQNGYTRLHLKNFKNFLILRANTSDISTFTQIFINKEYDINIDFEPKVIIDCGAYVGYSAVYFSNRFPGAKIICLEPAKSNYKLLVKNTSNYKNIFPLNVGLWSKKASLIVKDEGYGEWGFLVQETDAINDDNIQAISINEIIEKYGLEIIDILKIDIEGSEVEIFSHNYETWLNKVKVLIIELHDRIRPGCSDVFYGATKLYNFSESISGENIVLVNNDIKLNSI